MSSRTHTTPAESPDDGSGRIALAGIVIVLAVLLAGVGLITR